MEMRRSSLTPVSIPGLDEARARESEQRDLAFLALGDESGLFNESIAGVTVKPFTMRHLLWCETVRSPFVTGAPITPENAVVEIVKFLRIVGCKTPRPWFLFWRELTPVEQNAAIAHRMFRTKARVDETLKAIQEYLTDAFADAPASNGSAGVKYFSNAAAFMAFAVNHIPASLGNPLDLPFKVVFQLVKAARVSEDPKATLFNPSDQLVSRWLAEQNKAN